MRQDIVCLHTLEIEFLFYKTYMLSPIEIVQNRMLDQDPFSKWLGIKLIALDLGQCTLKMKVNTSMMNGFQIGHGGITYALSDSAFAFASNSYGFHAVSVESSISHIKPVFDQDMLTATALEISRSKLLGSYEVKVKNQNNELVSHFKGTAFIKKTKWE